MVLSLSDLETQCAGFVRQLMASNDPAHDVMHIERVVANARRFAASEGARLEIVVPAAWLHDCVTLPKDSPQRAQASRLAAAEAIRVLTEWGCEPDWLPAIAHAIEAHSFTAGIEPRSIEAKVVQDADRLEALGAVGLSRMLMLGGFMRRPLYQPDDPFCESRVPDDRRIVIDHCYAKLLHVGGTMQTAAGRREAEVRTAFIEHFLDELRREIDFSPAR